MSKYFSLSCLLGSLCIRSASYLEATSPRACLSVQRRVEGFIAIHAVSVLALVSTCYKCKCGICIILYFSTSMKSTKVSHLMPLVRGNSRWLLYFRLMRGLAGRGLLPVHQLSPLSEGGWEGRTMISRATRHPVSATASVM
jgi:hypothetical protein